MGDETDTQQAQAEPTFEQQTAGFVTAEDTAAAQQSGEENRNAEATESDESGEAQQSGELKPPKNKNTAQSRIQQLVAEKHAAAARERELERRLAALEKQGLTKQDGSDTSATTDAPPKSEDFEYGELDSRYIRALAKHEARQEYKAVQEEAKQVEQKTAAQKRHSELLKKATAFESAGGSKFDDFDEIVIERAKNGEFPVSAALAELIFDSDVGPEVAYHLASNPKEAQEVASLSERKQAAYFGRLEAKFSSGSSGAAREQTAQARTTQAPPPPKNSVRGGGSKTGFDPNNFAAFEAHVMGRAAK